MELVRGGDSEVPHLDDGFDPSLSGRALGHHQDPDGLDGTILGLAQTGRPTTDGGPGGFYCIEGIGLALVAAVCGIILRDPADSFSTYCQRRHLVRSSGPTF